MHVVNFLLSEDLLLLYFSFNLFPFLVSGKYVKQELKYFCVSWRHQHETESKTMIASLLPGHSYNPATLSLIFPENTPCSPFLSQLLQGSQLRVRENVQWPPKLEQPLICEGISSTAGWWPESLSSLEADNP